MKRKATDDLRQELMEVCDLSQYLKNNEEFFETTEFSALIDQIFERKGISKAKLAKQAGVSSVYVYQIFGGSRLPSRDKLLSLCIGMQTTVDECQSLLKAAGLALLYNRSRRDTIIMYGLIHGLSIIDVNEKLYDENELTLD